VPSESFTARSSAGPSVVRIGGWLFQRRTSIPVPLAVALLLIPGQHSSKAWLFDAAGVALVAAGEWIRLWAVRHIGGISRTRSDRLGPLVATGPFAHVRNPLYIGNMALWVGFALSAHLPWLAVLIAVVIGVEYHAIARWEEQLLVSRRGDEYQAYMARVPRWMPATKSRARRDREGIAIAQAAAHPVPFSWRETFYSERGTLIAIAAGYLLLWVKNRL